MNPLENPQFFHSLDACNGEPCCIHQQSNHHMTTWPLNWRQDRGIMERVCPHGIGHPDPDDRAIVTGLDTGAHGCDGCCVLPSPDTVDSVWGSERIWTHPRTGECPACGGHLCRVCGNCKNLDCELEAPCP